MIPVRYRNGDRVVNTFTLDGHHWLAAGDVICIACDTVFAEGDQLALVYVGPGNSAEAQEKYLHGHAHTGAAVVLHKRCAGVMT